MVSNTKGELARAIIMRLGGNQAIMREYPQFRATRMAYWKKVGIPPASRPAILEMAAKHSVRLTRDMLNHLDPEATHHEARAAISAAPIKRAPRKPVKINNRERVLRALRGASDGLTAQECAERTRLPLSSINPRLHELRLMGLATVGNEKRAGAAVFHHNPSAAEPRTNGANINGDN